MAGGNFNKFRKTSGYPYRKGTYTKSSSLGKRSSGNLKAAFEQRDQSEVVLNCNNTVSCRIPKRVDGGFEKDFNVAAVNVFDALYHSEFFGNYAPMYDQVKIDKVKAKITSLQYPTTPGTTNNNLSVVTAIDRNGLDGNQLVERISNEQVCIGTSIGKAISTYSSALTKNLSYGSTFEIIRYITPFTVQEKGQYISTDSLKQWYRNYSVNGEIGSNRYVICDQNTKANDRYYKNCVSNNPCYLEKDAALPFKPTFLIGAIGLDALNGDCIFNVELDVCCTFRGLRKSQTIVGDEGENVLELYITPEQMDMILEPGSGGTTTKVVQGVPYEVLDIEVDDTMESAGPSTESTPKGRGFADFYNAINEKQKEFFTKLKLYLPHGKEVTPIEVGKIVVKAYNDLGQEVQAFSKEVILNTFNDWVKPTIFKQYNGVVNNVAQSIKEFYGYYLESNQYVVVLQKVYNSLTKQHEIRVHQILNDTAEPQIVLIDEKDNDREITLDGIIGFLGKVSTGITIIVTGCKIVKEIIDFFKDGENPGYQVTESEKVVFSVPEIRLSDVNVSSVDEEVADSEREICDINGKIIKGGNARKVYCRDGYEFILKTAVFIRKTLGTGLPISYYDLATKVINFFTTSLVDNEVAANPDIQVIDSTDTESETGNGDNTNTDPESNTGENNNDNSGAESGTNTNDNTGGTDDTNENMDVDDENGDDSNAQNIENAINSP